MPRPIRLRKPPSAPSATVKTTTAATTTAAKKGTTTTTTVVTKSRTTRSGTKDIPDHNHSVGLPTPSSEDAPPKKSTPAKKISTRVAAVTKRATRSKVTTNESTVHTPSPRKPTTRQRKPAAKEKASEPEPEPEPEATPVPTPRLPAALSPPPPSSPEIQVPASSDAENHSPQHFASSPPVLPSTPPRVKRRVVLEFDSDAGYSPPPAKQNSAERPRLRELQPVSLEPLDSVLPQNAQEEEETDDTTDPRASPTPKRGRKSGFLPPPSDEDYENEIPTSAQPSRRVIPPPTGGVSFFVEGVEEAFVIYSDPKSPTPSLPLVGTIDDTMRPPESSPEPTPVQRKRRSSGAVVDSDEDVDTGDVEDEAELAADRKGKKRRGKTQKEKVGVMLTSALMDLLPRRKRNTRNGPVDEFEILSTSEENQEEEREDEDSESEDELSKPAGRTTRSGRNAKVAAKTTKAKGKRTAGVAGKGLTEKVNAKTKGKGKARATSVAPAAVTKSAWGKPLVGKPGKTYARRSIGSEKENDSPNKNRGRGEQENETGSSSDTVVIGDGVVEKQGRRKLKEVAEKFKEVDRWELEFEDVSQKSLEVESEGGR